MFLTKRRRVFAGFIILFAMNACGPQESAAPKELLPVPRSNAAAPDKKVRINVDKSPMDMIYFPVDYPLLKMSDKTASDPIVRVIYSRPEKDGRTIFGGVIKYGESWRLGANEATEIEFFTDVTIQDKKVKKGRYVMYCVPFVNKWTLILNTELYVWGLKIRHSKDLYAFDIPVTTTTDIYEVFTMQFISQKQGMQLMMAWDNVQAVLPINY